MREKLSRWRHSVWYMSIFEFDISNWIDSLQDQKSNKESYGFKITLRKMMVVLKPRTSLNHILVYVFQTNIIWELNIRRSHNARIKVKKNNFFFQQQFRRKKISFSKHRENKEGPFFFDTLNMKRRELSLWWIFNAF